MPRKIAETGDTYLTVTNDEILAAIPELARVEAIFSELPASTAYVGLKKQSSKVS